MHSREQRNVHQAPTTSPGRLITFEGIEGSGKSTQCRRIARWLRAQGYAVIETREPGGTPLAERIRSLLLKPLTKPPMDETLTPQCEVSLILAGRAQHVHHVIRPALAKGTMVLCDRFADSTLAYQGYGRNLDLMRLRELNRFVTDGIQPHLTFLFDIPVTIGLARRRSAAHQNRLDRESLAFYRRVRQGFLALAHEEPERIVVLNARHDPDALTQQLTRYLSRWLTTHTSFRPESMSLVDPPRLMNAGHTSD